MLIKDKLYIGGVLYKGGPIDSVIEKAVQDKNRIKGGNEGAQSGNNLPANKNNGDGIPKIWLTVVDSENSMQVA